MEVMVVDDDAYEAGANHQADSFLAAAAPTVCDYYGEGSDESATSPYDALGDLTNVRTAGNGPCDEGAVDAARNLPHEDIARMRDDDDEGQGDGLAVDQDGHLSPGMHDERWSRTAPWGQRERANEVTNLMASHRYAGPASVFYTVSPSDVRPP